ncbi:MAG: hypothetical protein QOF43_2271 [Gaiellaceae bacterium]|nr:hypothetical protein [Gaiellaceae bacterium]
MTDVGSTESAKDEGLIWTGSLNDAYAIGGDVGLYDTTLRDGEQTVGVVLDPEQKLEIARLLDDLGVDRIEAGFPRVSDDDWRAVELIAAAGLRAEIWVCADGYWCDHTKLLCPGELRAEYRELERGLLEVYERAIAHCKPGASLADLDRLTREGIAALGYPGQPTHPVCHGVGARAHEPPYAHQAGGGEIAEGMVLAIEPGCYWEGGGGLRVEDNFVITSEGAEKLSPFPDGVVQG